MLLRICSPLRKAQIARLALSSVQSNRPRYVKATLLCLGGGAIGKQLRKNEVFKYISKFNEAI